MDSRSKTSFILLTSIITAAKCGSYFELVKNAKHQIGGQDPFSALLMHTAFFDCDKEPKCTHVIQLNTSEEYVMVYGEDALKKMAYVATIWKKMAINSIQSERKVQLNLSNIALGKPVAFSRVMFNGTQNGAVDGSKKIDVFSCAMTYFDNPSWQRVDLQATAMVQSVSILSREAKDRAMATIDVRAGNIFTNGGVGNPPCQLSVTIPANSTSVHAQCPSEMAARYVTVNTQGLGAIVICEIEVYGYYV